MHCRSSESPVGPHILKTLEAYVKILANGMFCVSLLWWSGGGGLQAAPQSVSSTPARGLDQADARADAGASTPIDPSAAAPETPPQQQPAAQQPEQPPTAPGGPIVQAAPDLPKYPDVRLPGESGFWIDITGWIPKQQPTFNKGTGSNYTALSKVTMAGKPKYAIGAEVGVAIGLLNFLRLSGFETRGGFGARITIPAGSCPAITSFATSSFRLNTSPGPIRSKAARSACTLSISSTT
jgi:hypothetical protein